MRKEIKGIFASKTDIGKVRISNEDQAFSLINADGNVLLGVCDGMGGHNKGDYASHLAMEIASEEFRKKKHFNGLFFTKVWLSRTVKKINSHIYDVAYKNIEYKDMGTTLVMALLVGENVFIINVGDSRAYFVRYNDLKRLTVDQTYVEYLHSIGRLSEEEMRKSSERHILMNAIGTSPSVSYKIDVFKNLKKPILLCSDGLYNNASEREIFQVLHTEDRIDQKIDTLFAVANANGGSDNMAIAYWEAIEND